MTGGVGGKGEVEGGFGSSGGVVWRFGGFLKRGVYFIKGWAGFKFWAKGRDGVDVVLGCWIGIGFG